MSSLGGGSKAFFSRKNRFADLCCDIPNLCDHKLYRRKSVKLAQKQNYNGRELWILASIV